MKKALIFLLIFVPSLALLYFGLTRDPRTLPSALVHKPAPDFELARIDGGKVELRTLKGLPLVINFWSTWCSSCAVEHQLIREAVQKYASSPIRFYSVLYEDTPENAKSFIGNYGKGAPILLDPGLRTSIDYGVSGVPETFFIDRNGIVRLRYSGPLTPDILFGEIDALLQEGS